MQKGSSFTAFISVTALIIGIVTITLFLKSKQKIGYVIIQEVFEEFRLKKELESKFKVANEARKKILDSLQIDLSILSRRIQSDQATNDDKVLFERKKIEYSQKMQLFEEDNGAMTKQFDEQIVKQLNQYVSDYGKENKYDIVYGNSNGSIMYGAENLNITKDVIQYINEKYSGIK